MLAIFIVSIFGSIFLSVFSATLFWRSSLKYWIGFIPVISMPMIGILMLLIFDHWMPPFLSLEQYIACLYLSCLLFFVLQFLVVVKITNRNKR